jgi:hypothetical protein
MSIFGSSKPSKRVNNIRVTQSTQGYPITAAMGQVRLGQSLMWMGGFIEQEESGGKGGGKSGSFYLYYADVIAALCNGPITGIGSVWSGQTWLNSQGTNETITVTDNYSPENAALLVVDNSVGLVNTYSQTYTDYGQPVSTVLNGSDLAPMKLVPYGTALTTGEYSISFASIGTFNLTSSLGAGGGSTNVYNGTFTSPTGASGALIGYRFTVGGFTNSGNNGTYLCTASSTTQLTLANPNGVAETHAATAEDVGNTYHFAAADAGKSAQVTYQLNYSLIEQQDITLVPASGPPGYPACTVVLSQQYTPTNVLNVQYYGEDSLQNGVSLTPVTGAPTVTGTYKATLAANNYLGSNTGYSTFVQFAPGDIAQEVLITWSFTNQSSIGQSAPELINFEMFGGGQAQAPWSFLSTGGTWSLSPNSGTMQGFAGQSLGYTGIAYVAYGPMFLGDSGEIADNTFEVLTPDAYGGGIVDANPVQCILQVLTNTMWGLGSGQVPFPVLAIDNGANGTWGGPVGTPGTRATGSTAFNWFAANGFFISPKMDNQESAASQMSKWLEAGMCAAFFSEGLLKLVPYGSTSAAGNGCTWVGPSSWVVALDDSCFIANEGEDPVKITRTAWQDAYNQVQVSWENRFNQYADEITQEFDQAAINRYGLRQEDPQNYDFIHLLSSATFAANMRVKRMTSIRNKYAFTLPFSYSYVEPMDIVTITTSSIWAAGLNNINLGINDLPLRVTKVVDDATTGLSIECEDYQALAQEPVLFNKGISTGSVAVNQFAVPGNTVAVLFEATSRLTNYQGNQIWVGATGSTNQWGGCNVWVSQDAEKYLNIGTINQQARIGTLAAAFPAGSDPDTTDELIVTLEENSPALDAGTTVDADYRNTMCFVDGEIISYSTCEVTGDDQYTMNAITSPVTGYIRRGQMGSQITAHDMGAAFMRLDQAIFKYTYDPQWAGQTLLFKFQSVNNFNANPQDLSTLTPLGFTVPGLGPGSIDSATGLVITPNTFNIGAGPMSFLPNATT